MEKLLSIMFSSLKTMDNCLMQIVYLGELFAQGTMCQVSSFFARLASGPLVEFQMRSQIQRSFVPFV